MPPVQRMRERFDIGRKVMAGDRGMHSQKRIDETSERVDLACVTDTRA